jgi:hypothetical protein
MTYTFIKMEANASMNINSGEIWEKVYLLKYTIQIKYSTPN